MKTRFLMIALCLGLCLGTGAVAASDKTDIQKLGKQAIQKGLSVLKTGPDDPMLACLTNAGYVSHQGRSTRILYDVISENSQISLGRGNLLVVHTRWDEKPWLALVRKVSETELMLTHTLLEPAGPAFSKPLNVRVNKGDSFERFKAVLGKKAFSLVTFANGWADGIPEGLMTGALFHDHLCCGVFSGYFTAKFIQARLPLATGQRYIYIGAPAWCQDDYLMRPLNLTPGKHGYYTMGYHWSRPWKTKDGVYPNLGGILIRFDGKRQTGQASLLCFDWREEDFKQFVGMPELKLDWQNQPWLHVWYNKFFISHLDSPEKFVSVLKVKDLKSQRDLDRLIKMGANPLAEILGPDEAWISAFR